MQVQFDPQGWEDFRHWLDRDPKMIARIREIIRDTRRNPYSGIGKPEPLKGKWQGYWSRRIGQEHRFIYRIAGAGENQTLMVAMCRYHCGKR